MSITTETMELTEEIKSQLDEVCSQYYEYNQEYKSAETNKKLYNDMIKQILTDNGITKYTSSDGIKISMITTNKPSFCEEQLIPYLKSLNLEGLVKTREYVDMEALEDAIYHGQIDAKELSPFKEDHFVTRLNCTKPKLLKE